MSVAREALASGERALIVTHGNLLALILKWVDGDFGYDGWAKLSNPDAFIVRVDSSGSKTFSQFILWRASEGLGLE